MVVAVSTLGKGQLHTLLNLITISVCGVIVFTRLILPFKFVLLGEITMCSLLRGSYLLCTPANRNTACSEGHRVSFKDVGLLSILSKICMLSPFLFSSFFPFVSLPLFSFSLSLLHFPPFFVSVSTISSQLFR